MYKDLIAHTKKKKLSIFSNKVRKIICILSTNIFIERICVSYFGLWEKTHVGSEGKIVSLRLQDFCVYIFMNHRENILMKFYLSIQDNKYRFSTKSCIQSIFQMNDREQQVC